MPKVTLIINGGEEFEASHPMITIGRAAGNTITLDDSNVSQYHARVEQRADGYWLVDQGSSNGSSVNGITAEPEVLLQNGDTIVLGGTSKVQFNLESEDEEDDDKASTDSAVIPVAAPETAAKKSPIMMIAGVVVGIAVLSVVAGGAIYWATSGKKCEIAARVKSPTSGKILSEETTIGLEVDNPQCVDSAIFMLDGKEFARATEEPFTATISPDQFGDEADGLNHRLKIVLIDQKGERLPQGQEVVLAFETLETPTPTPEETETPTPQPGGPKVPAKKGASVIETQQMVVQLLKKRFPNAPSYKLDQQFLVDVNKATAEFATPGFYERAAKFKDAINVAYVTEQNLDAPLGYYLAMSRSKFILQKQGNAEGLWQMENQFATDNTFNGNCGDENLSSPSQNCAARASSLYYKILIGNVFEGDIVYGIAAIGKSPQEAAEWKAALPQTRAEFGKIISSPKQREQVVKFFAAAVVTENPAKFGLDKDKPISQLFSVLVGN